MKKIFVWFEQLSIARHLLKWTILTLPVSIVVGSLVALFLWLLEKATHIREANEWLLFMLPLAGILIHFLYKLWGKNSEAGNNLIMDEIHEPGGGVPARMTPLVMVTTIITHLFGGSAGREGTAVQMGGSMAGLFGKWFRLSRHDLRIMLMCGVAAGFGSVFGTPVTGAIFALEVIAIGVMRYDALLPCLIASILADATTRSWGIHHVTYQILSVLGPGNIPLLHIDLKLLFETVVGGVAFGLASYMFSELSHTIKHKARQYIKVKWLIPVCGALFVMIACYFLGTDYIGLGVTGKNPDSVSIVSSFHAGGATYMSWFWKLLLTAVTLSTGFKGGEVTPLFFIGATLGNAVAMLFGAPVDLFAAMGFIAVFAGATNTPLACTFMGIELFGASYVFYFAIACFTAYYFSGHTGIYTAQRLAVSKVYGDDGDQSTLAELRKRRLNRNYRLFKMLRDKFRK